MSKGIDCASKLTATNARAIKAAGYDYVMRYLGTNWKSYDKHEAGVIQAAGLHLVSIYETNPTHDSYFTPEQGESDAKQATKWAEAVGQPKGSAIYFAVDYGGGNANVGKIKEYFKAIRRHLKNYKVGGYGSYVVVKYLHEQGVIDYVWQTYAWSNGQVYDGAHMLQYANGRLVDGIQVDLDDIFKNPGAWDEAIIKKEEKQVEEGPFKDVPADRWSEPAIKRLKAKGIFRGYSDGTFKPVANITREEMAAVIDNLLNYLGK